jgi:hypothetical protein
MGRRRACVLAGVGVPDIKGRRFMKKFILFLCIVGGVLFMYQRYQGKLPLSGSEDVISNPVYAEFRVTMSGHGRDIEFISFGKTRDEADCNKFLKSMSTGFQIGQKSLPNSKISSNVKSSKCGPELPPRYAGIFDDAPLFTTYISMAKGDKDEREMRMIPYGIDQKESDMLCDEMARDRAKFWKGAITCVRAIPVR